MKGQTPKWVSSKSEKIANDYASRILERDSQEALGSSVSSDKSDNNIFLKVVGGVDKKSKRICGLSPAGENYIPSSKQLAGISESEFLQLKSENIQMKNDFSNLTAENQSLKKQVSGLYATQEKMYATHKKMLKFMEAFYQTNLSPSSPPPTIEDGQQFDDECDDEQSA